MDLLRPPALLSLLAPTAVLVLALGACDGAGPARAPACALAIAPQGDAVAVTGPCGPTLMLRPRIELDGTWIAPERCDVSGGILQCSMGAAGLLEVSVAADETRALVPRFVAAQAVTFGGFELSGEVDLGGATAWLSNGFQSWSQSGALALGDPVSEADQAVSVAAFGDDEVLRTGEAQSWWHTWVAGGAQALVAGVLEARRLRSWVSVGRVAGGVRVRLVSGGVAADRAAVASGEAVRGEPWSVQLGPELNPLLRSYGGALAGRRDVAPAAVEVGWNSWYELWDGVDAGAVRANAARAAALLGPRLPAGAALRVVIDDGWQRAWGDWTPNAKFPGGLAELAASLHAAGFEVGVWLAPLLVARDAPLAQAHPDWLVGGASYRHPMHGELGVLDVTHPGARAHLHDVVAGLVADGIGLLKIDFLFAGTFAGTRAQPLTGMQAYQLALETIRAAAGEETLLLAVGAPGIASLPFIDAWRLGGDIALEPFGALWPWLPNQARSVAARWPLCLAVVCDADPPLLRDLPQGEVEVGAWIVALAGGGLFLSDDLRALPDERVDWALSPAVLAAARTGTPAEPLDLVPATPPARLANALGDLGVGESRHVVPGHWRTATNVDVLINVEDEPRVIAGETVAPHAVVARTP